MNDRKDDGTTWGGIVIAIACLICFAAGYWVRDLGFRFYVQQTSWSRTVTKRDKRYPPYWNQLSDLTLAVTLGQCSRCWWRRAALAHHAWYPWYWLQLPWLCLFGVCRKCHGIVHRDRNWIEHQNKRFSHNTFLTVLSLQIRMIWLIAVEIALLVGVVAIGLAFIK